jgi:hypothetical protein
MQKDLPIRGPHFQKGLGSWAVGITESLVEALQVVRISGYSFKRFITAHFDIHILTTGKLSSNYHYIIIQFI